MSRKALYFDPIEYFVNTKQQLITNLQKYGCVISLTLDLREETNKRGYI